MNDTLLERFGALGTATVSDALDKHGRPGSLLGIAPLADDQHMVGRAFTVRYVSAQVPAGTVGDFIDQVEPGQVVVLDNDGRVDCTVWGDILTAVAHHRGIAGTVIEGVCRDTHRALSVGYPIFSRGRFMRTGKDRVEVAEEQGPVTIGGVTVRPGDILLGDSDGVVAIPQDLENEILETAEMIHAREESIVEAALNGATIAEARAQFGYHDLQRADA
ncbi:regulator of RNase E activity RraA [Microbacterium keratanolyticum]|uniref:Putative 4-hydroxy-4-methyl-2-oxoglutarate aldolase n=2 Tax=Microbacterium keratanolyticum TaxID=67574 RepID=A0A9W6M7X4_9MICO|nr:RraA family protein [Microbacterium keratanolyticum]MBM7468445.1 regulator of RNase E activity RraA [Microbacterium keratanolyticum]GLK00519.1 diguanylate cyclase [Microbacterium keratanolyticum]